MVRLKPLLTLRNGLMAIALCVCLGLAYGLLNLVSVDWSTPGSVAQSFRQFGQMGIALYVGAQIVAIVVSPIPGTPLTLAGGTIWHPIQAGLYSVVGIVIGSLMAYTIGRTLGRSAVKALTGKVIFFSGDRGESYLGWLIFAFHLLPGLPFDFMTYGAGISGLSFRVYARSMLLGTIPCTFFLTHMGASIRLGKSPSYGLLGLLVVLLIGIPLAFKQAKWLNLKNIIRIE